MHKFPYVRINILLKLGLWSGSFKSIIYKLSSSLPSKEKKKDYFLELIEESENNYRSFKINSKSFFRPFYRIYNYKLSYINYLSKQLGIFAKRDVNVKTFWGSQFKIPLKDVLFLPISFFGLLSGLESRLAKFLVKNLESGDIFYDIGANYGFYSALAAVFINRGEIHAFEPSPRTCKYFKDNLEGVNNCKLNEIALSEKNGDIIFYDLFDGKFQSSGRGTIVDELASTSYSNEFQKISVTSRTLDSYISTNRAPTFLKIDVEGGEEAVLQGGKRLLEDNNVIIAMEVWKGSKGKKYSANAIDLLYSYGYQSYRLGPEGNLEYTSENIPLVVNEDFENFIFKKSN